MSGTLEHVELSLLSLSSSSMRWTSGGGTVKAELIKGDKCKRGLVSTVNVSVEL
jgi:hypothetical protein